MFGPIGTQLSFFSIQLILSAFISIILGFYFLRTRVGLKVEVLLIFLGAIWGVCYAYEIMSTEIASKLFWAKMQFLGKATIGLGYLLFLKYNYDHRWLRRPVLLFCTAMTAVTLALVFSNERHGLMWSAVSLEEGSPIAPLKFSYGPWHWLFLVYNMILITSIAIVSYKMLMESKQVYQGKVLLLSICYVAPSMASVFYLSGISPFQFDFSPLLLNVSTVAIAATSPFSKYNKEIFHLARSLIFDRMKDAVVMLDEEGRILDMNAIAKNLIGHGNEVAGKLLDDVMPHFGSNWDDLWVRYWHTGLGRREVMLDNRVFEISASPILDWRGQIYSQILVLHDISEQKRLEDSLRGYSEHLEDLVEERTKKLRDAERLAAIGELSAMIGHDLRNPLTGIAGATYYLRNKVGPDEKSMEMLNLIDKNIKYSDKIISDLLDYSRSIKLDWTEITPIQIVQDALSVVTIPENVGVSMKVHDDFTVSLDVQKMKRVFSNIIKNAIEAMPDGGELSILSERRGENIVVSFSDTGKGIPEGMVEKIGAPLFTTKAKGMGLGVAICKRFVKAHNGVIEVESQVGEGTMFRVIIPIHQRTDAEGEAPEQATPVEANSP